MTKVLKAYAVLSPLPLDKATPTVARLAPSMSGAAKVVMLKEGKKAPPFTGKTQDINIPTTEGDLAARVYTPAGNGPFPTVLYIHGGGWVIADIDVYDSSARALCEMSKALVISAENRKEPEHKYRASHDEYLGGLSVGARKCGQLSSRPREVAVAGESAGGNMAASICLMAKQKGVRCRG